MFAWKFKLEIEIDSTYILPRGNYHLGSESQTESENGTYIMLFKKLGSALSHSNSPPPPHQPI